MMGFTAPLRLCLLSQFETFSTTATVFLKYTYQKNLCHDTLLVPSESCLLKPSFKVPLENYFSALLVFSKNRL